MPFGATSKIKEPEKTQTQKTFDPVFFNLPNNGSRIVRFLGDEVQVKMMFWDKVNMGDGKVGNKPILLAVTRLNDSGEVEFVTHDNQNLWDNPISTHYRDTLTEDEIKTRGLYPKQRFYLNVLDRTLVLKTDDGGILYPEQYQDSEGNVRSEFSSLGEPFPHEKVLILNQTSGKDTGDHYYNAVREAGKQLVSNKNGKKINIDQSDFRLTNSPSGKKWNGFETITRNVYPHFNQDVIPSTIDTTLWDLAEWLQPWPYDAIQDIIDGEVYSEVVEKYGIRLFPIKVDQTRSKTEENEDLPF